MKEFGHSFRGPAVTRQKAGTRSYSQATTGGFPTGPSGAVPLVNRLAVNLLGLLPPMASLIS